MHDEEVLELEGPFSAICASGTVILSTCVLGDQNAGKSSFFHSLTKSDDPNFLQLTSLIPYMSASFINTRFLTNQNSSYIDGLGFNTSLHICICIYFYIFLRASIY